MERSRVSPTGSSLMPFLLDTDWVIDVLHAQPHAVAELPALSRSGVSVSIVSYAELYEGAYYARDQQAALTALQTFLSDVPILPVSTAIAQRFGSFAVHCRGSTAGKLEISIY